MADSNDSWSCERLVSVKLVLAIYVSQLDFSKEYSPVVLFQKGTGVYVHVSVCTFASGYKYICTLPQYNSTNRSVRRSVCPCLYVYGTVL